jgi:uncharacterized protein (TIGR00255 family)
MPIASMTGFARGEGQHDGYGWTWEARSVNARGLEIRCRLPIGFEGLEPAARQKVSARLKRGHIALNLILNRAGAQADVRINTDVLDRLLALLPEIQRRLPASTPPAAEALLGLRGVIEVQDATMDSDARSALDDALLAALDAVLSRLEGVRGEEGARLHATLKAHVCRIRDLTRQADSLAALQPQALLQRLIDQVNELAGAVPPLPADRLAQEAVVLALKVDPREELDRLRAHAEAADALLNGAGPIGRQLDFLCQEFNREANTLCSKSIDIELTRIGLDLKTTIDQLREQVQNIE